MDLAYSIFQFPVSGRVFCAFQGRSPCGRDDTLAGNISYQVGDEPGRVLQTRRELFSELNQRGVENWSECRQVHGKTILESPGPTALDAQPDTLPAADGMMTDQKGFALMIKTADCQPLFIASKDGCRIMALHVGWRGNRLNFPGHALSVFCERYSLSPEDLLAVRGPSLGPAMAKFENFDSEWGPEWKRWFDPRTECMNLWELTRWQLMNPCCGNLDKGIPENQIYGLDICTFLNHREYFSYRQDRQTGRQASFIWITG